LAGARKHYRVVGESSFARLLTSPADFAKLIADDNR
jgi:hypothetical protein